MDVRPTLSVGMLTWNSGARLHAAIASARVYANEIILGVDDSSDPLTYDLACRLADVVFRFEHTPVVDSSFMHLFRYATSDWFLLLADDERLAPEHLDELPSLLRQDRYTHYILPTQFLISLDPLAYIHAPPYYPDYHVRLMRNDVSLVNKLPAWHTNMGMAGAGCILDDFPIRHYERVMRTSLEREEKVLQSRANGWPAPMEATYLGGDDLPRVELPLTAHPEYVFIERLGQTRYGTYKAEVISGVLSPDGSQRIHAP